jgi:hypothetical protein
MNSGRPRRGAPMNERRSEKSVQCCVLRPRRVRLESYMRTSRLLPALLQLRVCAAGSVAFACLLVSCGGSGDALAPEAGNLVANLRVSVKPEGSGGPERVRLVECAVLGEDAIDPRCRFLGGLEPRDLEPVPRRTACPQVYGGPATAQVTGRLRGVRVWAEFDLSDACEIARWRRNAALLGAPGVGHGGP